MRNPRRRCGGDRGAVTGEGLSRYRKSCKLCLTNFTHHGIKRKDFSDDEEDLIVRLYALLGNRWSLIAGRLPGRTGDEVKNYWTYHLRRKLAITGINPSNIPRPLKMIERRDAAENSSSGVDTDCVSDAASSVEENSYVLPDLNLELTPETEDMKGTYVLDKKSSLTLPLFV